MRGMRSQTCSELSVGARSIGEVLALRDDARVGHIHLLCLLESLPGVRKIDVRRRLASLGLAPREAIGSLSDAEVASIEEHFGGRGNG